MPSADQPNGAGAPRRDEEFHNEHLPGFDPYGYLKKDGAGDAQSSSAQGSHAYGTDASAQPGTQYGGASGHQHQGPAAQASYGPAGLPSQPQGSAPQDAAPQPMQRPHAAYRPGWMRPSVSFGEAIRLWWKNLLVFNGRATRSEYWWVMLATVILNFVVSMLTSLVDLAVNGGAAPAQANSIQTSAASGLGQLLTFLVGLSLIPLAVRRFHDINRSGWWYLAFYVLQMVLSLAVVIPIVLLILRAGDIETMSDSEIVTSLGASIGIIMILAMLLFAVYIVQLVWTILPSKPQGARFDDPSKRLPAAYTGNWVPGNPEYDAAQRQYSVNPNPTDPHTP
ncbi:DUF805 domain-containing protein [Falsarthrobacter nasiphocae]|uniref:Uncharacterized membrane protein YhaH (DUF805 family) n=1 Tax=Falsarthrobacter nasiphocae TaxID=189863 RepID=A0AAE3YF98_9MICC|nr:DUF805 domain-containing protein [Falsarthrobacter nasiphocae]MDR6892334.1 uncharacterized membrane protein YhaH (DUF805 family) [Falsarthrobacter nasiphocae]